MKKILLLAIFICGCSSSDRPQNIHSAEVDYFNTANPECASKIIRVHDLETNKIYYNYVDYNGNVYKTIESNSNEPMKIDSNYKKENK